MYSALCACGVFSAASTSSLSAPSKILHNFSVFAGWLVSQKGGWATPVNIRRNRPLLFTSNCIGLLHLIYRRVYAVREVVVPLYHRLYIQRIVQRRKG